MPCLGGAVPGEQIISHARAQKVGQQRRRTGNETVQHHRSALRRGAQHHAGQHADLEAADLGQHVERVAAIGGITRQGTVYHGDLAAQLVVAAARPAPGRLRRWAAGHGGGDGARGGGVADPHVAGGNQVGAIRRHLTGKCDAGSDTLLGLCPAHRRADADVPGAGPRANHAQVGMGRQRRPRNPRVDDQLPYSQPPAQHAHRRAAGEEVGHHLRRDRLRVAGHPLRHHAVVGGGHDHRLAANPWPRIAQNAGQPDRNPLQPPQAAGRLGERALPSFGAVHRGRVQRADPRQRRDNLSGKRQRRWPRAPLPGSAAAGRRLDGRHYCPPILAVSAPAPASGARPPSGTRPPPGIRAATDAVPGSDSPTDSPTGAVARERLSPAAAPPPEPPATAGPSCAAACRALARTDQPHPPLPGCRLPRNHRLDPEHRAKVIRHQHILRHAATGHCPAGQQNQPIAVSAGQLHVVQRNNHGGAARSLHAQGCQHRQPVAQVETGQRFVEHQHACLLRQRTRQQHPLPLAAGQAVEAARFEAHRFGTRHGGTGDPAVAQPLELKPPQVRIAPHQHRLQCGERLRRVLLRQIRHPPRARGRRHAIQIRAAEPYGPRFGAQHARKHAQQGALAGAVGPDHPGHFAAAGGNRHRAQHRRAAEAHAHRAGGELVAAGRAGHGPS